MRANSSCRPISPTVTDRTARIGGRSNGGELCPAVSWGKPRRHSPSRITTLPVTQPRRATDRTQWLAHLDDSARRWMTIWFRNKLANWRQTSPKLSHYRPERCTDTRHQRDPTTKPEQVKSGHKLACTHSPTDLISAAFCPTAIGCRRSKHF
jgi:hypothetical protein